MAKSYDPRNWYWNVGGDTTQAFSSAAGDFVTASDPTFVAWLASGGKPTKIDTEFNLGEVLARQNLRPLAVGVLDGYLETQLDAVDLVQFRILLNHENRIRTLASQPNINAAQFRGAIKALL